MKNYRIVKFKQTSYNSKCGKFSNFLSIPQYLFWQYRGKRENKKLDINSYHCQVLPLRESMHSKQFLEVFQVKAPLIQLSVFLLPLVYLKRMKNVSISVQKRIFISERKPILPNKVPRFFKFAEFWDRIDFLNLAETVICLG